MELLGSSVVSNAADTNTGVEPLNKVLNYIKEGLPNVPHCHWPKNLSEPTTSGLQAAEGQTHCSPPWFLAACS